jgi:hypothetical protein
LEAVELTTELRVLGREGRSGAEVVVVVAGLTADGEDVVIAVEAAGLPAVGAEDNAEPAYPSVLVKGVIPEMGWTTVDGGDDSLGAVTTHWGEERRERREIRTHQQLHLLSPKV